MKILCTLTVLILTAQTMPLSASEFRSQPPRGTLHVITGSMCSGKSEETIRLTNKLLRSKHQVLTLKPGIDNRKLQLKDDQDPTKVLSSRAGTFIECVPVSCVGTLEEILEQKDPSHIVIDEAHFFTPESKDFVALIVALLNHGKQIIVSGLDLNFRGEPFGPMPELLAYADSVEKFKANCVKCHLEVYCISQRLINGQPARYHDPLIMVGAEELYEPRCRSCHECPKE